MLSAGDSQITMHCNRCQLNCRSNLYIEMFMSDFSPRDVMFFISQFCHSKYFNNKRNCDQKLITRLRCLKLSRATRKPVFGGLRPDKTKTAVLQRLARDLEFLDIVLETRGIILSKQWITKALIGLCGCACWSAPLLFAYGKNRISHDVAQLSVVWLSLFHFNLY